MDPLMKLEVQSNKVVIETGGVRHVQRSSDPVGHALELLTQVQKPLLIPSGAPPFCGGWVGYFSYDFFNETKSCGVAATPLAVFNFFKGILAYSHRTDQWWSCDLLSATENIMAQSNATYLKSLAVSPIAIAIASRLPAASFAGSNFAPGQYISQVNRVLDYIRAGDIYQINLAQRFSCPWPHPPSLLFESLREQSPAQYGAFLGSGLLGNDQAICSISPELFLSVRGDKITTRPIKGTRPRDADASSNEGARRELAGSSKEIAELNMIIDLERNDLGRICDYGSIRVTSAGDVEELPTLFHRVGTVEGRLRMGCTLSDILHATFPGGSITGAPKIRAMQIIDELEPDARGAYSGAIGWIGINGDLDLSIAIRTALFDGTHGVAHYHAGSGIVADSIPEKEHEETLHKAAAFFRATQTTFQP